MKKIVAGLAALVVLVVGGVLIYSITLGDAPPRRTVDQVDDPKDAGPAPVTLDGTWRTIEGSTAGYRIKESFVGGITDSEAVGSTSEVAGTLQVRGATIPSASFEVQVGSLRSDKDRRDNQARRVLDVEQFPTAAFVLTQPIELGEVPAEGEKVTAEATGDLTVKGTTRPVTFTVSAKHTGSRIALDASIPFAFADFGVDNPSIPGIVSVVDQGAIEIVLLLAPEATK